MKQSEINLLTSFVKHCERVLTQSPPPSTRDTKTYNAYRIARYKELEKVKKIIIELKNYSHENNDILEDEGCRSD